MRMEVGGSPVLYPCRFPCVGKNWVGTFYGASRRTTIPPPTFSVKHCWGPDPACGAWVVFKRRAPYTLQNRGRQESSPVTSQASRLPFPRFLHLYFFDTNVKVSAFCPFESKPKVICMHFSGHKSTSVYHFSNSFVVDLFKFLLFRVLCRT